MKHKHSAGSVSIKHIVKVLNEILETDPVAVSELGRLSVPCNRKLADHPTVQVRAIAGKHDYRVGLLGILNGVLSAGSPGIIQAVVDDDDNNKLLRFKINPSGKTAHPVAGHKHMHSNSTASISKLEALASELGGTFVKGV